MRRLKPITAALAALTLALVATACTTQGGPVTIDPGVGSPTVSAATGDVAQAKTKAAQYDYDAALALLASDNSAAAAQAKSEITAARDAAVAWTTPDKVPHLFWHPLVIDPKRGFSSPDVPKIDRDGNAQYMVTQKEFAAQLQSIYDKGYVLVHPERLYAPDASGAMKPTTPIKLPAGKKPMVISEDDVNYYSRWDKAGFARLLKLTPEGKVVNTYQDAAGNWHEGAYDVITMIDEFVALHPDFSYRGDKGSIAVTGYEGVLGYRSSVSVYGDTDKTRKAIADATKVADALKADGWNFASHTWHHISYSASSPAKIKSDMELWNAEVKPIVGATPEMIFAFGSDIATGIGRSYAPSDPKYTYLHDTEGYDYYFPIDNSSALFSQIKGGYYRQWRVNVDGITMQKARDGKPVALNQFFDTMSLWDPDRPIPTPTTATGVK